MLVTIGGSIIGPQVAQSQKICLATLDIYATAITARPDYATKLKGSVRLLCVPKTQDFRA